MLSTSDSLLLHLVETEYWDFWAVVPILYRCSHLPNATQWDVPDAPTVTEYAFGRSEVESRLNVSQKEHSHYHTLECVASLEGEEAYTLFSISGTMAWGRTLQLGRGRRVGGDLSYLRACTQTEKQARKPTDLGPAKARCAVSGYRLNEIRTCWRCRLGLYAIDWLILRANKRHCCRCLP